MDIRSGGMVAGEAANALVQAHDEDPDGKPSLEADGGTGDLPTRSASRCRSLHKIRRMDDPEILERVLAGLLTLS